MDCSRGARLSPRLPPRLATDPDAALRRPIVASGNRTIDLGARDLADAEDGAARAVALDGVAAAHTVEVRGWLRRWWIRQRLAGNYAEGAYDEPTGYAYGDSSGAGSGFDGGAGHGGHHGGHFGGDGGGPGVGH